MLRIVFWILLGLSAALFFEYGIWLLISMVVLLMAVTVFVKGGRETLSVALNSLADGARHALPVGVACALVGTIIGMLTLTGAATNFVRVIVSVGETSIFLSLVLTAITSLVLGMGIPTIPNYIITSSIAAPALLHLGVPLIVSHMFVFYFGIMADLTPPVALAAFAAASIAKESGFKIGWTAVKIALPGWIVPFMAVYAPALMLQPVGPRVAEFGFAAFAAYMIFKAVLAVTLWGMTATGYFLTHVGWPERIIAFLSAALLVVDYPWTDPAGFTACGAVPRLSVLEGGTAPAARSPSSRPSRMELCLLAAGATVRLGTVALTLAWTHSIEKMRWEEDWRATPAGLVLQEDRIQATGAGMEPPPDAKFDGTWWRYNPHLAPMPQRDFAPLRQDRR